MEVLHSYREENFYAKWVSNSSLSLPSSTHGFYESLTQMFSVIPVDTFRISKVHFVVFCYQFFGLMSYDFIKRKKKKKGDRDKI